MSRRAAATAPAATATHAHDAAACAPQWSHESLQRFVRERFAGAEFLVVSHGAPYVRRRDAAGAPCVHVPAGGLVAALEPVVRSCGGAWIAHDCAGPDRAAAASVDSVAPADAAAYRLRSVPLTAEELRGYCDGFANEGLWPLCHRAGVAPTFRAANWRRYVAVNERFAAAVDAEARTRSPVVLTQDYHLALLPGVVRALRPDATLVHFWHVPWPEPGVFATLPWGREILRALLQADVLGFQQTRGHCRRFLGAVERAGGCVVDRERMIVRLAGHVCRVAAHPISVAWDAPAPAPASVEECRLRVRQRFGIAAGVTLGLAVERWDYTKGIVERFVALERLLDERPEFRGRITLLQVLAPSRAALPAYAALHERALAAAARLDARFATAGWRPLVLVPEHQPHARVVELYRAADFCHVNSLHDGMNLVAKEFVRARDDLDGVLILSTHAGAALELTDALHVEPRDASAVADAFAAVMGMAAPERRARMLRLRNVVRERNVHRWAAHLLLDAAAARARSAAGRGAAWCGLAG